MSHTTQEASSTADVYRRDISQDTTEAVGSPPILVKGLVAALRLSLGWVFAWAFLDKTFGLGHATPGENAWVEGGSPTSGFLTNAPSGPFESFYSGLAGQAWVDWIFMVGLLGIGVALLSGVVVKIAAVAGAVMLVMMWTAILPPENNPFMDDHLVYALILILLAALHSGRWVGLGSWWERRPLVRDHGWLA